MPVRVEARSLYHRDLKVVIRDEPPYRFDVEGETERELTVLLACRWILARLRHQRFFSLEELNAAIRPLLTELNERPFQRLPGTRRTARNALNRTQNPSICTAAEDRFLETFTVKASLTIAAQTGLPRAA